MLRHPAERWSRLHMSRRDFLRRTAAGATALPTMAALLAACKEDAGPGTGDGEEPELRIGTPDSPVELQVFDDNPPIQSDLEVEAREGATLKIFNWNYYLSKSLMRQFGEQYGVTVELTTFDDMADGIAKVTSGQVDFDLFFGVQVFTLGRLIAGGFLRPLNLDVR